MSEYKIGQMLECIDVSDSPGLTLAGIYTTICNQEDGCIRVMLDEGESSWYSAGSFEPYEEETTEEHTGGSSSYYTIHIPFPTTQYALPYTAECNDLIETLGMTPAEANVFKAIWRGAAARQGKKKKGNNAVYDAEKCVFFSGRMLVAAKREN